MSRVQIEGRVVEISEWLDVRETVRQSTEIRPQSFTLADDRVVLQGIIAEGEQGRLRLWHGRVGGLRRKMVDAPIATLTERTWMQRYEHLIHHVMDVMVAAGVELPPPAGREPAWPYPAGGLLILDEPKRDLLKDRLSRLAADLTTSHEPFWTFALPLLLEHDEVVHLELEDAPDTTVVKLYGVGRRALA